MLSVLNNKRKKSYLLGRYFHPHKDTGTDKRIESQNNLQADRFRLIFKKTGRTNTQKERSIELTLGQMTLGDCFY